MKTDNEKNKAIINELIKACELLADGLQRVEPFNGYAYEYYHLAKKHLNKIKELNI